MDKSKKLLLKNTVFLYILQFSSYFFSFLTVPYQTRVLGSEYYGKLGFALAAMTYFQLFIDFGFLLSATAETAQNRNDKKKLSQIFTSVTILKVIFSVVSIILLIGLAFFLEDFKADFLIYALFLGSVIFASLMPDYLYRGLEQMSFITVRAVSIKFFFTIMIFLLMKKPEDYYLVPLLQLIGNAVALLFAYYHLKKHLKIGFIRVKFQMLVDSFKHSSQFFLSRIATTVYGATNTIILGIIDGTGSSVGFYTAADKVVTTAKNGLAPISDSVYPYMLAHKDFKLIKKILMITMPFILGGAIFTFVYADQICLILFGPEFTQTANILRAMLPIIVIILPTYILGFPTLGAMGLSKYANYSIYSGTIVQILLLILLYNTDSLNMVTLALASSISELTIFCVRLGVVYRNRKLFK